MMKTMMAAAMSAALLSTTAMAASMGTDTSKDMGREPAMKAESPMGQSISATNIEGMPKDGMVRVMGTVKSVDGEDQFTLMDGTGSVDVKFDGQTQLMEGEKVTVIGEAESGMMGKSIEAEKVTKGFETSEYRAESTDYRARPVDQGYEAPGTGSENVENNNHQGTKTYNEKMSMNDYNKRLKTSDRGQTRLQPEKGPMGE